jgi:hypothetical protein
MDANLDLLLTVVYCITDDFLPQRAGNARRRITDPEIITLCVAQAIMGLPSDERFLAVARYRLQHLFPYLPAREAFHKRRLRVSGQIEALIAEFARRSPGFFDDLLLVDSTPVDKNFRGKDFETELTTLDASIMRPRRKDEPGRGPHLAPIRQRIESIFQTCKDILTLERHGARTLANLRVRLCARFAALAAAVMLNHQLGRPSRSLVAYTA